jgi:hypothetical protein
MSALFTKAKVRCFWALSFMSPSMAWRRTGRISRTAAAGRSGEIQRSTHLGNHRVCIGSARMTVGASSSPLKRPSRIIEAPQQAPTSTKSLPASPRAWRAAWMSRALRSTDMSGLRPRRLDSFSRVSR